MKIGTFSPEVWAFSVSYGPLFIKLPSGIWALTIAELLSFLQSPSPGRRGSEVLPQFRNRFFSRFFLFRIYTGSWQLRTKPDNEPLSRLTLMGLFLNIHSGQQSPKSAINRGRGLPCNQKGDMALHLPHGFLALQGQQTWRGWAPCLAWVPLTGSA